MRSEDDTSAFAGLRLWNLEAVRLTEEGLSKETDMDFVSSLIEASLSNRTYSDLFMTTIPDPLSGFLITISSRFFC